MHEKCGFCASAPKMVSQFAAFFALSEGFIDRHVTKVRTSHTAAHVVGGVRHEVTCL